jgi:glutathione S-transferase
MSLKFFFHPLASYCQKVLIALYENGTPFEPHLVDFSNEASAAAFRKLWPVAKMPVLRDEARDRTIPESSIIIEYLAQHYPGPTPLIPADAELALQTRLRDRFYDLYVHDPMQRIVGDRLRPAGKTDPYGVEAARAQLLKSYGMIDAEMAARTWAMGEAFTLADCAAGPPLFFANKLMPFGESHRNLAGYFERLTRRPSFARSLAEAEPYMKFFPG